ETRMSLPQIAIEMWRDYHQRVDVPSFKSSFVDHLRYSLARDAVTHHPLDLYSAMALSVRDRLIDRMMATLATYEQQRAKRVYYLSLEYLIGRSIDNNLVNLGFREGAAEALDQLGMNYE